MAAFIDIESVTKVFNVESHHPVLAIRDVSLQIRENEFVTLVGRSGCGKSTLLRLIDGLSPATRGRISIGGAPVTGPRRDVALMFQRPALLPWRSVLDNVLLPVEVLGLDRRAARQTAEELLALVGLEEFRDHRPYELSGGMQQRAALCRALIQEPSVLLMDEPFGALDALTREELSLELQRIFGERRTTIVFVTHSIPEAVLLADRVIVMTPRPGRIAREIEIDLPRPRSLGAYENSEALKRYEEEVHDLLFAPDAAFAVS